MCLVSLGEWRRESGAEKEPIPSLLCDRPWLPSLFPDKQAWALHALIYLLSSFPSKRVTVSCLPAPLLLLASKQKGRMGNGSSCHGEVWGGLLCLWWGNAEKEVAAKAGAGGCRNRWLCAQGDLPVWGRSMWEFAQLGAAPPETVQAGLPLWAITWW